MIEAHRGMLKKAEDDESARAFHETAIARTRRCNLFTTTRIAQTAKAVEDELHKSDELVRPKFRRHGSEQGRVR